jgi:hypothetical protein
MKSLKFSKKQILILFVFSIMAAIVGIIHGIFFDLDWEQVKRLTLEGFVLTLVIVFPGLLFLEWVFDLNNKEKFDNIETQLKSVDKRLKSIEKRK